MISECLSSMAGGVSAQTADSCRPAGMAGGPHFHDFFLSCLAGSGAAGSQRFPGSLSPKAGALLERAAALVKNRSLAAGQLRRASRADLAEVSSWLLAGAGGLAPVQTAVADDSAGPLSESSPATLWETTPAETAPDAAPVPLAAGEMPAADGSSPLPSFAAPLPARLTTANAFSALADAANLSPLASLTGLMDLKREDLEALGRSLFALLATFVRAGDGESTLDADSLPGSAATALWARIADALPEMSGAAIKSLFAQAASLAGCDVKRLISFDLPAVALRSLALETLEVVFHPSSQHAEIMLDELARSGYPIKPAPFVGDSADSRSSPPLSDGAGVPVAEDGYGVGIGQQEYVRRRASEASEAEAQAAAADKASETAAAHGRETLPAAATIMQTEDPQAKAADSPDQVAAMAAAKERSDAQPSPELAAFDEIPLVRKREAPVEEAERSDRLEAAPAVSSRHEAPAPHGQRIAPNTVVEPQLAENLERVEQALRFALRRGISQVAVELSPPELGRLNVRIEMRQGVVSAIIQAEKAEARHLLMSGVEQLRQNLQAQGVELDFFDVYLGNQGHSGNGEWDSRPFKPARQEAFLAEEEQVAAELAPVMAAQTAANRLDLVV